MYSGRRSAGNEDRIDVQLLQRVTGNGYASVRDPLVLAKVQFYVT